MSAESPRASRSPEARTTRFSTNQEADPAIYNPVVFETVPKEAIAQVLQNLKENAQNENAPKENEAESGGHGHGHAEPEPGPVGKAFGKTRDTLEKAGAGAANILATGAVIEGSGVAITGAGVLGTLLGVPGATTVALFGVNMALGMAPVFAMVGIPFFAPLTLERIKNFVLGVKAGKKAASAGHGHGHDSGGHDKHDAGGGGGHGKH